MIISHKYRYLFLECPLTASWAIRHELCDHYSGIPIHSKHSMYPEFAKSASSDERNYFVFATIRNPLDIIVSQYMKLKHDHKGVFSDPETVNELIVDYSDYKKFQFIQDSNATFEDYFLTYHKRPYGNMLDSSRDRLDFVIHFENLQDDFSEVLRLLEIKQVSAIPQDNKTVGKKASWEEYYTPKIIEQAKKIVGPTLMAWGYRFPEDWGDYKPSRFSLIEHQVVQAARSYYSGKIRYSDGFIAKVIRKLRAKLIK